MPRVHLPLVGTAPNASFNGPEVMVRACQGCGRGDRTHRGLVFLTVHFATLGVRSCLAPSGREPALNALLRAESWAHAQDSATGLTPIRAQTYSALNVMVQKTWDAVKPSLHRPVSRGTPLDVHADHVVRRYVGLAATYAVGACLTILDGVHTPALLVQAPEQVAGALAYQRVGLGVCRSEELRRRALEAATWEAEHSVTPSQDGALSVQLFHEYLGSAFNDIKTAISIQFGDFIHWALEAAA